MTVAVALPEVVGVAGSLDWSRPERAKDSPTDGRPDTPGAAERTLTPGAAEDEFDAVMDLLDDEYAQRILAALADRERPARELMDACDASRATVYRRLNRLEEHGLVEVGMELHRDGHHRKVFTSTLERATVELADGTPRVRLVLTANSGASTSASAART